ncbi:protein Jade-1-like isoform X1 [Myxocyprinus asiaticus]|uniref:protein Jade-1-like isoform X1 n=2 Tax=Myxocyprinus asiaticus TaxID=70543 RepID=UPI0022233ADB|nr:protein Jade-1-like isoform X1 [Myxocyprinus asiaticus]XP_051578592.1 protein Jade-1-like isoform X1 [Myxocyprinus asiaticus]XP_051578593.1 protein Jade-1-like isoform X1 [Myxocyprinus asiaticus]
MMKRSRVPSTSDDSDNGSNSTSWSQHSNCKHRKQNGKRPSEVFRTDLITAMKLHDTHQLNPEDYYELADPWRQEWEKGVQVPVSPESIPQSTVRTVAEKCPAALFIRPKKLIRLSESSVLGYVGIQTLADGMCRYDLNEEDVAWLQTTNEQFSKMGMQPLDELTMERVMEEFEQRCYDNMNHAMETEEGLGIEYDEDVVCDVCQSPDGEDGNEMVFCDKCNICVHQACYGILKVPEGSWLCRTCALGIFPKCHLCPKKGGAMKPTRSGTKWIHVSCALWIPEVSIGNPEKMEPITNVSHIPSNRWALICCLCKEKTGACIQCSAKSCRVAFHVTCGLHCGLKMNTILTEADEVKFKSFCPKHSGMDWNEEEGDEERPVTEERCRNLGVDFSPSSEPRPTCNTEEKRLSERKLRVQQLEDEFYRFVTADEVAEHLQLPLEMVDFLFQYWKLKRKVNFNKPLIMPKKEEEDSLARREQEVLLRRLRLFTHLRQDLERVRNLTYMVSRRERIKRTMCRVQEQIFHHHIRLLEQGLVAGISSTRRLEEAMFYFRTAPPVPPYPQPLKGHCGQNSALSSTVQNHEKGSNHYRSSKNIGADKPAKMPRLESLVMENSLSSEEVVDSGSRGCKLQRNEATAASATVKHSENRLRGSVVIESHREDDETEHPLEDRRRRRRSRSRSSSSKLWEQVSVKDKLKQSKSMEDTVKNKMEENSMDDRFLLSHSKTTGTASFVVNTPTTYNGSPRKTSQHQGKQVPNGTTRRHLNNWGSFRIPKRSERTAGDKDGQEGSDMADQNSSLIKTYNTNFTSSSPIRTRLRTGSENRSHMEVSDLGQSEQGKRCHAQRLRSHDPMTRRYGSNVIQRGVLAS